MNKKSFKLSQQAIAEHMVATESPYIDAFDYARELEQRFEMENKKRATTAEAILNKMPNPKVDKFNHVYFTFFFYGLTIGLPWNVFLPIINLFASRKLSVVDDRFEKVFLILLLIIWQVTFVLTNLLNFVNCKGKNCDQRDRIPYLIFLTILATLAFIVYTIINPGNWVYQFLIMVSLVAFINSAAGGILFSSAFYTASKFPIEYTNIIIVGISFSSLLSNLISCLNKLVPANMQMYGITFFVLSLGCLFITFISHFSLSISPYYIYHVELSRVKQIFTKSSSSLQANLSYSKVFFTIWPYMLSIWLTVFATAVVFPNYQQKIARAASNFIIDEKWYTETTCNLTFNIMFLLGNITGQFKRKPKIKWIALISVLKSVCSVGFFLFCNYEQDKRSHIPVYIKNDFIYWSGAGVFAYLSGYIISLLVMCTPNQIKEHNSSSAAMLCSIMIVFGCVSGLQFSRVLEIVVLF